MQYSLRAFHPTGCEKMNRLIKNKKAVSPVIATVLMIMVTMAGMAILFGFVISYSDAYKAGIGGSVMESLVVEDIWLSPESTVYNSAVNLTIYNVGKVDSTITSVYANGTKLTDIVGGQNVKLNDIVLGIGEHKTITLYWDNKWQTGQTYIFTISTQKGSNFDVTCKAT
jgi:flagellin-like protein